MMDNSDKNNIDNQEQGHGLSYKQLILIIFITTLVVMGAMGFSFSVFDINVQEPNDSIINNIIAILKTDDGNNDNQEEPTGKLIFNYYEKPFVGNGIQLVNQFPTSDEVGKAFVGENYVFEFRLVLNENAKGIKYDIVAERLINSDLRNDAVKIYLESEGKALPSVVRSTGRIKTFNEFVNHNDSGSEKVIYSGQITKDEANRGYKDFIFKMWISEDIEMTPDVLNRTFISRINVYGSGSL